MKILESNSRNLLCREESEKAHREMTKKKLTYMLGSHTLLLPVGFFFSTREKSLYRHHYIRKMCMAIINAQMQFFSTFSQRSNVK